MLRRLRPLSWDTVPAAAEAARAWGSQRTFSAAPLSSHLCTLRGWDLSHPFSHQCCLWQWWTRGSQMKDPCADGDPAPGPQGAPRHSMGRTPHSTYQPYSSPHPQTPGTRAWRPLLWLTGLCLAAATNLPRAPDIDLCPESLTSFSPMKSSTDISF